MRTIKICPKCGAMSFIVTAHVTQDWVVDENGSYLHTQEECGEVTHQPDDSDIWTCNNCGYDAAGAEFNREVPDDYKPDPEESAPAADSGEDKRSFGPDTPVIAIDFDGTLCDNAWPDIGTPYWHVIRAAKTAQKNGACLVLWTNREGEKLEEALDACERWELHFDYVNENPPFRIAMYDTDPRKIGADEYWDDRAVGWDDKNVFSPCLDEINSLPSREWILSDNDTMQYIRRTSPLFPDPSNKNCWEVIQLVQRPDAEGGYGVAREHVDLSDYIGDDAPNDNKDDLDTILNSFGYAGVSKYASVSDVEVQYGLEADQVIAECIAETRFAELDRSELDYVGTEDACTQYIKDYVGGQI